MKRGQHEAPGGSEDPTERRETSSVSAVCADLPPPPPPPPPLHLILYQPTPLCPPTVRFTTSQWKTTSECGNPSPLLARVPWRTQRASTNVGKTTLTNKLIKNLVHHKDFFKPKGQIEAGEGGLKQYDVIPALDMDAMMSTLLENPAKIEKSHDVNNNLSQSLTIRKEEETHILKVEGFLLYTYRPLIDQLNQLYFHLI
ncbi:Nicotinamide riboside kinase 2 [Collichthys lucidus]|uniref:Nicotinamide riboside kinase 2 n=1 Tax=Collichthys lucidus TaxID=240159 RepID=A0A4U5UZT7_COLLU|nr:Nicotinamide riboside kinase 2 [Collichthys lucidus]